MIHYALMLEPSFGFARAITIRADGMEERGETTVFLRGPRLVHQVPTVHVREALRFDNQHEAEEHVKSVLQRRAGAATFHVQEYGVARRREGPVAKPQGGFLAESIVTVIEEG